MWLRNVLALAVIVQIFVPIKTQYSNESPLDDTDIFQSVEDEHGTSSSETLNIEDGIHTKYESLLTSTVTSQSVEDEHTTPTEPSSSDNYITNSPIQTSYPSSSLSSDDETYSGQIPLERPTESVPEAYGNNITINSPTLGNNSSISDSDGYGVTDVNGQDYTEPDGKPITSASAGEYGNLVTNTDGSVFTETEFIGGQSTASYNGDITTISNDSSNDVTTILENNTQGLVTDGSVEFPTSSVTNTDVSGFTEKEFIGGQSTASYNGDITTISNDSSNDVTTILENNTQGLVTDGSVEFPTSSVTNTDVSGFTEKEFIGGQSTANYNGDITTISNDSSNDVTTILENNTQGLVTDGSVEFPTSSVTNTDVSGFTEKEFIGGQSTASYNGDITTISNDSSNDVTTILENNTQGLVTDGSVEFPTSSVTNTDVSGFTEKEFIGGQSTASYNGDITTISNDSSNNVTAATEIFVPIKTQWSSENDIFQSTEEEHGYSSSDTLNIEDGSHTTHVSPLASTVIFESVRDDYTTPTKPSTSDNYITYSPIPTYYPSTILFSDNETYSGQIPLERPTESVPDAYGINIPTNSPTIGWDGSGWGSTQLPDEAIESGIDRFNVSADMQSEINPVTGGTCGLPEGGPMIQVAIRPVTTASRGLIWSTEDKALYFVDVYKPAVSKYTPANGRLVTLNLDLDGLAVKAILPTSTKHQFVVALDDRLILLQNSFTKDANVTTYKKVLAQFDSIYDLGVAKTDLQGRIWIPVRVKISNDKIITKLYLINGGKAEYRDTLRRNYGMAWSADNKYFYVADSESGSGYIYVYDFLRKDGSIKNRRILFDQNNYPKLSAQISDIIVDKNGHIWASIFENNLVIKIDHVSGNILGMIALPTKYPSCLAFGAVKQNKLFVGTAYTSSKEMDIPYTYVISKLKATGISATKEVQVKKIFGSTTINIFVSNGDYQSPPSDSTPTDSSMNEMCPINKTLLQIKDRRAGECTVVRNKPVVQEAIAPLETTVQGLDWDFRTNALYLADVYVPALIKYTPHNGKTVTVQFENTTTITAIIPIKNKDHNYVISAGHSLVQFENKFKENTVQELNGKVIASLRGKDTNLMFSRGRTDSRGRLWIGTRYIYPSSRKGTLYMLRQGKLISKISKVVDSGGMTWSLDKKNFYFADSGEGKIYSYDYNAWTGAIKNRTIFFDIKAEPNLNGTLTDIIIDNKDNIWASVFGGSMVICISRKTGSVTQAISLPIKYPVSLEFGGVKRDTLFVSGALRDTCKVEAMPYTYAISNTGVRGTSANYYYTL